MKGRIDRMSVRDYHKEIVAILDFGSQYTQLIARKVRELKVYCEIFPYNADVEKLKVLEPPGDNPLGRSAERHRGGCARVRPGHIPSWRADPRYLLRHPVDRQGLSGRGPAVGQAGVRPRPYLSGQPGRPSGRHGGRRYHLDEPWRQHHDDASRLHGPRPLGEFSLCGHQERERHHLRRAVPSRGPPYP